jgi:hypothetical protein
MKAGFPENGVAGFPFIGKAGFPVSRYLPDRL